MRRLAPLAERVGLFANAGDQFAWMVLAREDDPGACVITGWSTRLMGGASAQLIAREAKLRPQSGKLYLDIQVKGPAATVFVFRPESGTFEQVR